MQNKCESWVLVFGKPLNTHFFSSNRNTITYNANLRCHIVRWECNISPQLYIPRVFFLMLGPIVIMGYLP